MQRGPIVLSEEEVEALLDLLPNPQSSDEFLIQNLRIKLISLLQNLREK
jgi:uncharacterized protein (DUF1778 family)